MRAKVRMNSSTHEITPYSIQTSTVASISVSHYYTLIYIHIYLVYTPPFFFLSFLALSCLNAPPNIEIRQSNKHFHALDIASLSF